MKPRDPLSDDAAENPSKTPTAYVLFKNKMYYELRSKRHYDYPKGFKIQVFSVPRILAQFFSSVFGPIFDP